MGVMSGEQEVARDLSASEEMSEDSNADSDSKVPPLRIKLDSVTSTAHQKKVAEATSKMGEMVAESSAEETDEDKVEIIEGSKVETDEEDLENGEEVPIGVIINESNEILVDINCNGK